MKKRGFGEGKWNGAGGKKQDNETIEQATIREFSEETGLQIPEQDIKKYGILHFKRPHKKEWDQDVHVFFGKSYYGELQETEEMLPKWRNIDDIPYQEMRSDDIIWMPRFLKKEYFEYEFTFDENNTIIDSNIIK